MRRLLQNSVVSKCIQIIKDLVMLPVLTVCAYHYRNRKRPYQIGLGPDPLINNVYHKKALLQKGYTAATFVRTVFYITNEFDFRADLTYTDKFTSRFSAHMLFLHAVRNFECLYIYFNGGPLCDCPLLGRVEPWLYKLANMKIVLLPYGADVHEMTRSKHLIFKHAMAMDYPQHAFRRKIIHDRIDRWTKFGSHIIAGNDWVDFLYHWDTLMSGHFSIDTEKWSPTRPVNADPEKPLRILHAPNHRTLKGSEFFIRAIKELQDEGYNIEFKLLEQMPNDEVRKAIDWCDVVADQMIIGWYAMFALEGMSMERPVLCSFRDDLKRLYMNYVFEPNEILPLIRCEIDTVKETIIDVYNNRADLPGIGKESRRFVEKYHSTAYIGQVFDTINRSLGITPQNG